MYIYTLKCVPSSNPPNECWLEVRCCGPKAGLEEDSIAESAMERMMVSSVVVCGFCFAWWVVG